MRQLGFALLLLAISCAAQQPQPICHSNCGEGIICSDIRECDPPQQPTNIQHADSTPHSQKSEVFDVPATCNEIGCGCEDSRRVLLTSEDRKHHCVLLSAVPPLAGTFTWDATATLPANPVLDDPNTLTLTYDEVELLAGLLNQLHLPDDQITPEMRELAGKIEKLIGGPKR